MLAHRFLNTADILVRAPPKRVLSVTVEMLSQANPGKQSLRESSVKYRYLMPFPLTTVSSEILSPFSERRSPIPNTLTAMHPPSFRTLARSDTAAGTSFASMFSRMWNATAPSNSPSPNGSSRTDAHLTSAESPRSFLHAQTASSEKSTPVTRYPASIRASMVLPFPHPASSSLALSQNGSSPRSVTPLHARV